MVRKAFTLIELIFSIVVLSIAFLAIPVLLEMTSLSLEETVKDEATFQGIRTAGAIQTYAWDDNSLSQDANESYILDTSNGDSELGRYNSSQFRIGNYYLGKKRKFHPATTLASTALGSDPGDTIKDDIDDFNNYVENIQSTIVDLNVKTKIYYIADSANYAQSHINFTINPTSVSPSTNIKMIEVNITDKNNNQVLLYRTISCNIGSAPIKTRFYR